MIEGITKNSGLNEIISIFGIGPSPISSIITPQVRAYVQREIGQVVRRSWEVFHQGLEKQAKEARIDFEARRKRHGEEIAVHHLQTLFTKMPQTMRGFLERQARAFRSFQEESLEGIWMMHRHLLFPV